MKNTLYKQFLALTDIFKNKPVDPLSQKKDELSGRADMFLKSDTLPMYVRMLKSGYVPNQQQSELFDRKINEKLSGHGAPDWKVVDDLIADGYTFNTKQYQSFMNSYLGNILFSTIFKEGKSNLKKDSPYLLYASNILDHILELNEKPEYQAAYLENWRNVLNETITLFRKTKADKKWDDDDYRKELRTYNLRPDVLCISSEGFLFKTLDFNAYCKLLEEMQQLSQLTFPNLKAKYNDGTPIFQGYINNIIKDMSTKMEERYPADMDNIVNETKAAYMNEHATALAAQNIMNISKNITMNELPQRSKEYLTQIQSKYTEILPHHSALQVEDAHNLRKLMDEELGSIIGKYLSMNPEYRNEMKNNSGKTAADLLNESLNNIHIYLEDLVRNMNEDKINELQVASHYTGAKVKRMKAA